jgi:hypothetical protein
MNDEPQIDPRYDPAFQRGFSGTVRTGDHAHGVARASQQPVREARRTGAASGAPVALAHQNVTPPAYPASSASAVPADPDAQSPSFDDDDELVDETPPRRLTRNPFLFTLALLGAALIVAGSSWALAGRATMNAAASIASERDYWFIQAALLGAPVMIVAGVGILAGILFVFANAWNKGR